MNNNHPSKNKILESEDIIEGLMKGETFDIYFHDAHHLSSLKAFNYMFKQKECLKCPDFGYYFDRSEEKLLRVR